MFSIECQNLVKEFKSVTATVRPVDGLSLRLNAGEIHAVIGESGCGKTTLLRLIAGLERAEMGTISFFPKDKTPTISMVFQEPRLFTWFTVEKNVALAVRHLSREVQQEKVRHVLELVGLSPYRELFPSQLSGGMAQRVALVRTLINEPEILLLDEPLGALDAFTRMNMQDEILNIWTQRRQLALMVTHSIDEAVYMGTRVLVMEANPGRIVADIKISEDFPRDRSSASFVEYRNEILNKLHYGGKNA